MFLLCNAEKAWQVFATILSIEVKVGNSASFFRSFFCQTPASLMKLLGNNYERIIGPEGLTVTASLANSFSPKLAVIEEMHSKLMTVFLPSEPRE